MCVAENESSKDDPQYGTVHVLSMDDNSYVLSPNQHAQHNITYSLDGKTPADWSKNGHVTGSQGPDWSQGCHVTHGETSDWSQAGDVTEDESSDWPQCPHNGGHVKEGETSDWSQGGHVTEDESSDWPQPRSHPPQDGVNETSHLLPTETKATAADLPYQVPVCHDHTHEGHCQSIDCGQWNAKEI